MNKIRVKKKKTIWKANIKEETKISAKGEKIVKTKNIQI